MFRLRLAVVAAAALLLIPLTACTGRSDTEVVRSFLDALAAGNVAAAAGETDSPQQAQRSLEASHRQLEPESVSTSLLGIRETGGGEQVADYEITWRFGDGQDWRYRSRAPLTDTDDGRKVRWSPAVLHPQLEPGQTLARRQQQPLLSPVLDRDGVPLMSPDQVVSITLDPKQAGDVAAVAGSLADALGEIELSITQQSILDGVEQNPDSPYSVVSLRRDDYERVKDRIHDLPGVRFPVQDRLLATESGYASQALSGVSQLATEQATERAGWKVVALDRSGAEVRELHATDSQPAPVTETTLSDRVQRAAERAVDPVPQAAMLVAVQPSTGELLAVAQNEPADAQGSLALSGQYPPGSTFKTVTATAVLESGAAGIDTPVECPPTKTFNGRVIPNDEEFDLGTVPLRTAFAHSCNTTFAQLAVDQEPGSLPEAAEKLGLGVDFEMPGAVTITGNVPRSEDTVQRAENGIGQGKVVASPFGMALVAASAANGSMPVPKLIRGSETEADAAPPPLAPEAADQLRAMMREVVTGGTATRLQGAGEVAGKTGTAQYGDGSRAHGWFIGYRDDLAFAVLITDAGSSGPAVDLAGDFLNGL